MSNAEATTTTTTTSTSDVEVEKSERVLALKTEGNAWLAAGRLDDAAAAYTRGLALGPVVPAAKAVLLCNRAFVYIKTESYGAAIADADAAVAADPSYAKAYYRRGSANFALDKVKAARRDFRQVVRLKPKDRDARSRLAACEKAVRQAAFSRAIESEATESLCDTLDPDDVPLGTAYNGPHPAGDALDDDAADTEKGLFEPGRLPRDFVMAAIECFRNQNLIHKRYVMRLLISCKHYFEKLPSLIEISIPDAPPDHESPNNNVAPRVTVCGDTHGQFYDVLHIFEINGYPSPTNPYLFNGDFVDRGSFSVEVVLTYLLLKLSSPESVHLTRGNHETRNMNRIYGFEGEVKHKFCDDRVFELFLEVFRHLPLAAVVAGDVMVAHGGLPTEPADVTLDDVRRVPRGMEPPESGLMSDLLWSDPQPAPGRAPSKRGVGYSFGPDVTESFLDRNGLSLLVRSHEVKEEGYVVEHNGKCVTIFSAPNYCDSMGNKGAFIHFEKRTRTRRRTRREAITTTGGDEDMDDEQEEEEEVVGASEPKFVQFDAVPHPNVKPMAYAAGMGGLF